MERIPDKKIAKLCVKYLGWDEPVSEVDMGLARELFNAQLEADQKVMEQRELMIEGYVELAKLAIVREIFEEIDNLIIGVEGCTFEERLDGDKGCIVLDMNENQWQALKQRILKKYGGEE